MRHVPYALLLAGALSCEAVAWPVPLGLAESAAPEELSSEERVSRSLGPGQSHAYRLNLEAGELTHTELEPEGLPFTLALVGPDGARSSRWVTPWATTRPFLSQWWCPRRVATC